MNDYKIINGIALAFVGDSYYDLQIRSHLIKKGYTKPNDLHKIATKYVSAKAQSSILKKMIELSFLDDEELNIVKRARNYKSGISRKNVDLATYKESTSFEAVIGYWYLAGNNNRLIEIISFSIKFIEGELM